MGYAAQVGTPIWQRGRRVMYRMDDDAIVAIEVFARKTQATPRPVIVLCEERLREYDHA